MHVQRKPKSWFSNKLKALEVRLSGLMHFKHKVELEGVPSKIASVDNEIASTQTAIKRTRLESNFAELES